MSDYFALANAIRALSMDAVQKANSGHPGMPLGMADIATVLWRKHLKHNPKNPNWFNRDRFILSNGHGSMLLYSLLHLSGYDLSLDELKQFRQLGSKTPGHPEHEETPGVETTTGPLGQGLANAVGMALAEKQLALTYNSDEHTIVDHHTYVFVGDGCLMEGISHEVCSLAGTWQLDKLIVLYDANGISIDGKIDGWFSDNTAQRFKAYQWHVIEAVDGHDVKAIDQAILEAKASNQPSLIICNTHIGFGSPKLQDTAKSHGAPFGDEEINATKEKLGWGDAPFVIPEAIYRAWDATSKGQQDELAWRNQFEHFQQANPEQAKEFLRRMEGDLPELVTEVLDTYINQSNETLSNIATRKASENCLNQFAQHLPGLIGGSADLTGSNNTKWSDATIFEGQSGDYVHYGVREFGMTAIMNGLALHGGFIPFGGTFLVFSDYARNAIRLSAMMKQKVIHVLSHDSIGLGEDGPTHQPIEHITMLRATPELHVWRPADEVETAVAWKSSLMHQGASCLLLSRQGLPANARNSQQLSNIEKGGYILCDSDNQLEVILLASGSEIAIAVDAYSQLMAQGIATRVVSMPCMDIFLQQSAAYQQQVLPNDVTNRVAIEAGSPESWHRFTGLQGQVIGIERFGVSAPCKEIYKVLNVTVEAVLEAVSAQL